MREAQPGGREERTRDLKPDALWSRYANIRTKGEDSELNAADFRDVIECEMMLSAQDNPPLEGTFDAELELNKLRTFTGGEKKIALELFKDKLARQRQAYMQCRLLIERTIMRNPDSNTAELTHVADFFAAQYGFSDFAKDTVRGLIEEYEDRHKATQAFRAKYPDNGEIVQSLTDVQVEPNDVEVSEGPISIDILTARPTADRIYKRNGETEDASKTFQGFQGTNVKNNIHFTVVVRDAHDLHNIHKHEQEHVKNRVLSRFFDLDEGQSDVLRNRRVRIKNEIDPEVRTKLREEELTIVCDQALDEVRDELTAMFKDGSSAYFYRFYQKDGNSYDYLKDQRNAYYRDPDYAELAHEILVEEYERIIRESIVAFKELRTVGNRTIDEAIALLTDMPLNRWPSTVRHLIEHARKYAR